VPSSPGAAKHDARPCSSTEDRRCYASSIPATSLKSTTQGKGFHSLGLDPCPRLTSPWWRISSGSAAGLRGAAA